MTKCSNKSCKSGAGGARNGVSETRTIPTCDNDSAIHMTPSAAPGSVGDLISDRSNIAAAGLMMVFWQGRSPAAGAPSFEGADRSAGAEQQLGVSACVLAGSQQHTGDVGAGVAK